MIAIIPAREGSITLKNKNLLKLNNIPLVAHAILAAKKSKFITRVILSTESKKIAKIGKKYGAEIPFLRPKKLATSSSMVMDTYFYTIEKIKKKEKINIKEFIALLPTAPLRSAKDIDNSIRIFRKKKADSVIGVSAAHYPIEWNTLITHDGKLKDYDPSFNSLSNRQKSKKTFIPNGSLYIFKYDLLKRTRKYYFNKTYPYIMKKVFSVDIDDSIDFELAKILISNKNYLRKAKFKKN